MQRSSHKIKMSHWSQQHTLQMSPLPNYNQQLLKTNVWIKNLDILSTQYYQIKSICAVNKQTLEFAFIFLMWYFCPLSR